MTVGSCVSKETAFVFRLLCVLCAATVNAAAFQVPEHLTSLGQESATGIEEAGNGNPAPYEGPEAISPNADIGFSPYMYVIQLNNTRINEYVDDESDYEQDDYEEDTDEDSSSQALTDTRYPQSAIVPNLHRALPTRPHPHWYPLKTPSLKPTWNPRPRRLFSSLWSSAPQVRFPTRKFPSYEKSYASAKRAQDIRATISSYPKQIPPITHERHIPTAFQPTVLPLKAPPLAFEPSAQLKASGRSYDSSSPARIFQPFSNSPLSQFPQSNSQQNPSISNSPLSQFPQSNSHQNPPLSNSPSSQSLHSNPHQNTPTSNFPSSQFLHSNPRRNPPLSYNGSPNSSENFGPLVHFPLPSHYQSAAFLRPDAAEYVASDLSDRSHSAGDLWRRNLGLSTQSRLAGLNHQFGNQLHGYKQGDVTRDYHENGYQGHHANHHAQFDKVQDTRRRILEEEFYRKLEYYLEEGYEEDVYDHKKFHKFSKKRENEDGSRSENYQKQNQTGGSVQSEDSLDKKVDENSGFREGGRHHKHFDNQQEVNVEKDEGVGGKEEDSSSKNQRFQESGTGASDYDYYDQEPRELREIADHVPAYEQNLHPLGLVEVDGQMVPHVPSVDDLPPEERPFKEVFNDLRHEKFGTDFIETIFNPPVEYSRTLRQNSDVKPTLDSKTFGFYDDILSKISKHEGLPGSKTTTEKGVEEEVSTPSPNAVSANDEIGQTDEKIEGESKTGKGRSRNQRRRRRRRRPRRNRWKRK